MHRITGRKKIIVMIYLVLPVRHCPGLTARIQSFNFYTTHWDRQGSITISNSHKWKWKFRFWYQRSPFPGSGTWPQSTVCGSASGSRWWVFYCLPPVVPLELRLWPALALSFWVDTIPYNPVSILIRGMVRSKHAFDLSLINSSPINCL